MLAQAIHLASELLAPAAGVPPSEAPIGANQQGPCTMRPPAASVFSHLPPDPRDTLPAAIYDAPPAAPSPSTRPRRSARDKPQAKRSASPAAPAAGPNAKRAKHAKHDKPTSESDSAPAASDGALPRKGRLPAAGGGAPPRNVYKGSCWIAATRKFLFCLRLRGRCHYLGHHTEDSARKGARAFDALQLLLHGHRADTNFDWSKYTRADIAAAAARLRARGVDVREAIASAREARVKWIGVKLYGIAIWQATAFGHATAGEKVRAVHWCSLGSAEAAARQADCGLLAVNGLGITINFPASSYSREQLEEAGEHAISKGMKAARITGNLDAVEEVGWPDACMCLEGACPVLDLTLACIVLSACSVSLQKDWRLFNSTSQATRCPLFDAAQRASLQLLFTYLACRACYRRARG
jgi:hypothetical protein